jgi:hypothetical protein
LPVVGSFLTFSVVQIQKLTHNAAHLMRHQKCRALALLCLFNLAVFDVCFFRVGNPAGYVVHEKTEDFRTLFFVSMGPFFVNTFLCALFCTAAFLPVWELKANDLPAYFFYWLGLSDRHARVPVH